MTDFESLDFLDDEENKPRSSIDDLIGRDFLMKLINAIPRPVFVKDDQLRWVLFNDTHCDFIGNTREFLVGKTDLDLFPEQEALAFHDVDRRVLETGVGEDHEEQMTDLKGHVHTNLTRKSTFTTADGRRFLVGVCTDITERKTLEMELHEHREHLERLVDERSHEIEEQARQLQSALDKEKELNALQREFVAMVSHEFRTPLAVIDGAAQRILRRLDDLDPADIDRRIGTIRNAIMRLTELVESTLSASRLEAGKVDFQPQIFDLSSLVKAVCVRQQGISKKHSITSDVMELPDEVRGDPRLLAQVFTNLLSNAVKYSPSNPTVEVRGWREDDHACVSVRDHGLGISQADQERLFARFFRAKNSIGIAGTGIGLYLIKQLMLMHKGTVHLESEEGQGSTFTVRLPLNVDY